MGDRERSPRRRDRRSGGGGGAGNTGKLRKGPPEKRVFINNLPFEAKWQDVKDLFKKEVGEVNFVELFEDEDGRPRGAGVLELGSEELAKQAVIKMHRFDFRGRKMVVKEDSHLDRDKYGRIITDKDMERMRTRDRSFGGDGGMMGGGGGVNFGNTYGLSARFLESLGIDGPLHTRVFVANLSYDVDERKIKEVFRLAGKVVGLELTRDKEGKSRGFAVVVYEHPVEAVQAISMFHDQQLNERRMSVRFDKVPEEEPPRNLHRLPDGLRNVGMGLGQDGSPLWDVRTSLPNNNNEGNSLGLGNMAMGNGGGGGMDLAAVVQQQQAQQAQVNNSSAVALQAALATIMGMAGGGGVAAGAGGNAGGLAQNGGMGGGMGGMGGGGGIGGLNSGMNMGNGGGGMPDLGRGMDSLSSIEQAMNGGMGGGRSMSDSGGRSMGGMDRLERMDRGGMAGMGGGVGSMRGASGRAMDMDRIAASMGSGMGGGGGMGSGMSDMDRGMPGMRGGAGGPGAGSPHHPPKRSDKIMIKNLPASMNWQCLKDQICHVGDVKFAEIKERGVGIVRFGTDREAERAVAVLNGERLEGRNLVVSLV